MNRPTVAILSTAFVVFPLGLFVGLALGVFSTEFGRQLVTAATSSEEAADVANPQTIARDHFELMYPGNWTLAENDEYFDIDQYFSIDTVGLSHVLFELDPVDTSPQDNVRESIEYYSNILDVSERSSFDEWGEYSGVGEHLIGNYLGTQYEARIFSHSSGSCTFTVTEFFDVSTKEHVQPGYELIEATFVLDASEGVDMQEELPLLLGLPAPAVELETLDGRTWRLADSLGSIVVLDFWATWCGPCVAAMPQLQELHETMEGESVVVVGVNQADDLDDVIGFIEEKEITFEQVLDSDGSVGNRYRVEAIPQTVVIDAAGIVQAVHFGQTAGLNARLERQIQQLRQGEDLFDAEQVAKARGIRMEEVGRVHLALQQQHVERLEVVADIPVDGYPHLSLDSSPAWFTMPQTGERVLGIDAGDNAILLIDPASSSSRMVTVSWADDATLWQVRPAPAKQQLRWATTAYAVDDNYDIQKVHVTVFDEAGGTLWSREVPMFGEYPDLSLETGDFDGDGRSEVVVVTDYTDVDFGPDFPDTTRVLTLWDDDGTLLVRKWISGVGSSGIHVLSGEQHDWILIQSGGGIQQIRLPNDAEAEYTHTVPEGDIGKTSPGAARETMSETPNKSRRVVGEAGDERPVLSTA